MEVIKAEDLTVEYYSSGFSLKDVNLSFKEGEIVLLTGPSASGKTMLLYCLSGIIPHCINVKTYEGSVHINGSDVRKTKFADITKVCGYVLQNPTSQIFGMTVQEDMVFGLENFGIERDEIQKRLDETLRFINLEKYREANPFLLSGGEKQRVAIGSMLVTRPRIIFLDEPTSNLDPRGTKEVLSLLEKLKETKKTIILVERKIEHIIPFVDRVIALDNGKIVSDSEPRKFFADQDLVKKLGVNPPQVIRLAYKLIEQGINIRDLPISVQELYSMLPEQRGRLNAKNHRDKRCLV